MIRLLSVILTALLLSGCITQKGAVNYMFEHPEVLAPLCADKFPVQEKYVPGVPVVKHTLIPGEIKLCPPPVKDPVTGELKAGTVKCPPSSRDTVFITDTIRIKDTAALRVLQDQMGVEKEDRISAETKVSILKEKQKTLIWILGLLAAFSLISTVSLIKK